MKPDGTYRDVIPLERKTEQRAVRSARTGRAYIAVIGIDRYRKWDRLYNAVSDAKGALELFAGLGFELVAQPLFDDSATGDALRHLVVDDLSSLGEDDSLILFFAGHGHTVARMYGGASVRDGYLIPADGDRPGGRVGTWIRLESWLTDITRIPAKHILVVLDACHSGLALGPILQWRSRGMEHARREPLEQLRGRRSRRIITSALDDQLAMDNGPVPGHSLFTGCLIEAMTGGLVATRGYQVVTGSEIGHYVQRRVSEYPGSIQTPDFGALELDDRGELLVRIGRDGVGAHVASVDATMSSIPGSKLTAPENVARDVVSSVPLPSSQPSNELTSAAPQPDKAAKALSRDRRLMLLASAATLAIITIVLIIILAGNGRSEPERAAPTAPPTLPAPSFAPAVNNKVVEGLMEAPADALAEPRMGNDAPSSDDAAVTPYGDPPNARDAGGGSQPVVAPHEDSGSTTSPPRVEERTVPNDAGSTTVKPNPTTPADVATAAKHSTEEAITTQPRARKTWLRCSPPIGPVAAGASIHLTCQAFNTSDRVVRDVKYDVRAGIVRPTRVDGPSELPVHFASAPFPIDITVPVNTGASELEVVVTLSAPAVRYDLQFWIRITDPAATNGSATNLR